MMMNLKKLFREPDYELPIEESIEIDGSIWVKEPDSYDWMPLGIAPTPRSSWQIFWYHVGHGLVMQYPLWSILKFSWKNRHGFKRD